MSDFDKFFKEKLNEEQSFPRRNRNWNMVSKRLDAFDTGGQISHTHLRYWQMIGVAAGIAVGLLAWKLISVQKENTQLRQQITVFQENKPVASSGSSNPAEATQIPVKNEPQPITLPTTTAPTAPLPGIAQPAEKTFKNTENQLFKKTNSQQTAQPETDIAATRPSPAKRVNTGGNMPDSTSGLPNPPFTSAKTLTAAPNTPVPSTDALLESTTLLQKVDTLAANATIPGKDALQKADAVAQKEPAVAPPASPDSLTVQKDIPAIKEETQEAMATAQKDTVATAKAPPPLIKPTRSYDRLRAGAQVLAGIAMPQEKGVSALTGQGIQAEWRFWRSFSLLAGADWMRFDLNTTSFIPRFHPHHPHPDQHSGPGGPFPQQELVQVESTQRQRQLSLGLRYTLPVHFWVRPSLRISHNWVRIAPQLISFKYEEPSHGGPHGNPDPRYQVEKTETQRLDKVWRFGAGLERETPRWVFSIGADYTKDFSSTDAMFNTVMFRAGMQYKIL